MDTAGPTGPKRDNTTPSCEVCQRRKVKCNRVYPCGPCQKTGLECSFKPQQTHTRHRRKRVKVSGQVDETQGASVAGQEAATAAFPPDRTILLHQYEHDLPPPVTASTTVRYFSDAGGSEYDQSHSLATNSTRPNDAVNPAATTTTGLTPATHHVASLQLRNGRSGDSIYESVVQLGSEIAAGDRDVQNSLPAAQSPTDTDFIFRQPQGTYSGGAFRVAAQPSAEHVIQLWQAYLANVDPVMKVFHAPTVQGTILGQIGKVSPARSEQALRSAIYLISTVSCTEEQCQIALQQSRGELVNRFRHATEAALSAAHFVTTTDIVVLQGFVLYLAALRSLGETSFVWSMTGLAIRIAGTIGLPRHDSTLGLPPFENEMRRRLWWAIVYVDARTAESVGQDGDLLDRHLDVVPPSDVNDSELFLNMQRIPEGRSAATDMAYVRLRLNLVRYVRGLPTVSGHVGTWERMQDPGVSIAEKFETVEALEKKLDDEGLRYCDPTVPLQLLCINSAQTLLHKLRLVGNVPLSREALKLGSDDQYPDSRFPISIKIMKLQLALWTDNALQKWRWHWQGQFQWYAFAELIRQTRMRGFGSPTQEAWVIIHHVFNVIIPTLKTAEVNGPLLGSILALLRTAAAGRQVTSNAAGLAGATEQAVLSPAKDRAPVAQMAGPLTPGTGSSRHNALLPGMDVLDPKLRISSIDGRREDHLVPDYDSLTLGYDIEAIDWAEFDRLTGELCGQ